MIHKQLIVPASNLPLAAMLATAGYTYRVTTDPQGRTFLFDDAGDIEEMRDDFEAGKQSISDCKALLTKFEELRGQQSGGQYTGETSELRPITIETQEGRTWTSRDLITSTLLLYRGNELHNTYIEDGRTKFSFAFDSDLTRTISLFNQGLLRVEPGAWSKASFKITTAMREAKQKQPHPLPMSLSNASVERE
jgi:hypothetical protein